MSLFSESGSESAHLSLAATVGVPFEATVWFPKQFVPIHAEGLADLNLAFDANTGTVTGTPNRSGTFDILVHGHRQNIAHKVVFTLPVNADPASLWKNLPSDPDGPFARDDASCETLIVPAGARWIAASQRGRRHAHRGDYRDDAYHLCNDAASGWSVAAVADGAGSAELSREGARIAVNAAAEKLCASLSLLPEDEAPERGTLLQLAVEASLEAAFLIEASADAQGCELSEFATTLLLCAARRYDDYWLLVSFSIGDGLIASWSEEDGNIRRLCSSDGGEFAGETRFLSADVLTDAESCDHRLFIDKRASFSAVALMSDGVSDAKFANHESEGNSESWTALWTELEPLLDQEQAAQSLLSWLDFHVPGEHDDRTIALLIPT